MSLSVEDVTELRPGAKQRPLHAVLVESLTHTRALLTRLEGGVRVRETSRGRLLGRFMWRREISCRRWWRAWSSKGWNEQSWGHCQYQNVMKTVTARVQNANALGLKMVARSSEVGCDNPQ